MQLEEAVKNRNIIVMSLVIDNGVHNVAISLAVVLKHRVLNFLLLGIVRFQKSKLGSNIRSIRWFNPILRVCPCPVCQELRLKTM